MLLDSDSTGDQGAIPLGTSDWCRSTALGGAAATDASDGSD
jgi:hypothetical protein